MLHENQIIPYHSSDLTGKRVLVFAPHPDDETLACGGSLCLHAVAGDNIQVIVLTNGVAGDTEGNADKNAYIELRQEETIKACEILGIKQVDFLHFEDRVLAGSRHALYQIIGIIDKFKPELIYAPSALDFHPDHRAAHFLICNAVKSCKSDFDISFYEVNQLLNPNCIVDITSVSAKKFAAIDVYLSQLKEIDYKEIAIGLNRFRSLTLPKSATYAEAFYLINSAVLKKSSFITIYQQTLQKLVPVLRDTGPLVSVIIRTKDRPELLTNALKSIVYQSYSNFEIVLINDGGTDIQDLAKTVIKDVPVTYVDHKENKGRAAAANSGLRAAKGKYINFLDDDDIWYPDHLETLVSSCYGNDKKVVYSGIKSVYFEGAPEFLNSRIHEEVVYNYDFDAALLLFFKYIPIMSVLFDRDILAKVPAFKESLAFFEDWEFWIRVSRYYQFHHVNKITGEYRFYDPKAKEIYWRKEIDPKYKKTVFERSFAYMQGRSWIEYANKLLSDRVKTSNDEVDVNCTEFLLQQQKYSECNNQLTWGVDEIKLVLHKVENELQLRHGGVKWIRPGRDKSKGFIGWIVLKFRMIFEKIRN